MSYLKISKPKEIDQIVKKILDNRRSLNSNINVDSNRNSYKGTNANRKRNAKRDTLFGVRSKGNGLYIGKSPILITEGHSINDKTMKLTIDGINYNLTPGLLEPITKFNTDKKVYDEDDLENYKKILIQINAIYSNSNQNKPKSSRNVKYKEIITPIWKEIKIENNRSRIETTILPSNPNALT